LSKTHRQCPRPAANQPTGSFLRCGEPQGAREHRGLAGAAPGNIYLEGRGRGGRPSGGDAIDFPGGGIGGLGVGAAPPEGAAEERGAAVVGDLEGRGGRGQPRGRGGDVGGLPGGGVVAVEAEREVDGLAARGRAELEREARGRGRAAVRREAHVEEADLKAAAGVRRRRRVVHARGEVAAWRGRR
jgi:hypothetical protein